MHEAGMHNAAMPSQENRRERDIALIIREGAVTAPQQAQDSVT